MLLARRSSLHRWTCSACLRPKPLIRRLPEVRRLSDVRRIQCAPPLMPASRLLTGCPLLADSGRWRSDRLLLGALERLRRDTFGERAFHERLFHPPKAVKNLDIRFLHEPAIGGQESGAGD